MLQLTVDQYSKRINKSKQSIYNRIKRGTLKSEKIEDVLYVLVDEVDNDKQPLNPILNKGLNSAQSISKSPGYQSECREHKRELKELKKTIKDKDKEIRKLNKQLNKEKDNSIDVLKQFIGEMKVLAHNKPIETEIIDDDDEIKDIKKKKKKGKKK